MADYPGAIFNPREVENLPGIEYDAADTRTLFAEDVNNATAEIVAIEETLGENPQGEYDTVAERLDNMGPGGGAVWGDITGDLSDQTDLVAALDAKQDALGFTPENVANKSTSVPTDSASNTKYPTVKAVYDWCIATFQAALGYTPEDVANKSTSTSLGTSNTLYPSQGAVKSYVDTALSFLNYGFRAYRSGSTQSLTNGGSTKIQFQTESWDFSGNYDNATNYRFTAPVDGWYSFKASIQVPGSGLAAGTLQLYFLVNGTDGYNNQGSYTVSGGSQNVSTSADIYLAAGDYVEVYAFQNRGSATAGFGSNNTCFSGQLYKLD